MWAEWLSAVGIFVSLVLCSIVPYCLLSSGNSHRKHGNSLVLSLCNCVACGIFLSTCFLGLIPHVRHHEGLIREKLYANDTDKMNMSVPAPAVASGAGHGHHSEGPAWLNTEVVVLAGFVLILLIEQAMMSCSSGSGHSHSSHSGHSHLASEPHAAHTRIAGARLLDLGEEEAEQPLVMTEFGDDDDDDMDAIVFRKEGSDEPEAHHSHGGGGGHSHIIPLDEGLSPRSVLLLLGLGIHSVFEGVALGLQKDGGDFVKIMFAIMLHEVLCCVAFGVSLAQQRAPRAAAAASVAILAACIPAGMVAAFMVDALDSSHSLVLRFALEGLAAGTFVYVSCVEMLSAELQEGHGRGGVVKALSVGAGVLLFWVLQNAFKH